jgi:hypothetical protein
MHLTDAEAGADPHFENKKIGLVAQAYPKGETVT